MPKIEFGTGGIRAEMGESFGMMNKETVCIATQGLANYLNAHNEDGRPLSACISYDSRNNSRYFAELTRDVLCANGIKVYIFDDIRPTPELSYAVRYTHSDAGVMITASHNPKEYNGYKVFGNDGAQVTSPVDTDIVAKVAELSSLADCTLSSPDCAPFEFIGSEIDEAYMNDILSLTLSPEARAAHSDLKIVYTPLHGCGRRLVPECLARLGFRNVIHVPQQDVADGDFPTVVSPNPEEASALKLALEKARECGADLVLATDPDADRMGIAVRDDKGELVLFNGNQTASMLTYYILTRWKELGRLDGRQYVVKTIVTTELIREIASSFGLKVYDVLTGFKYIAEVVRRNEGKAEFVCGGEESYGFNVGEYVRDKDAQIACSMIAECAAWAATKGLSLYGLMQKIYSEYGYRKEGLMSVVMKGDDGAARIREIIAQLRQNPPKDLCGSPVCKVVDYLRTDLTGMPSSNVLQFFDEASEVVTVRPSGTEPKIKFYFGAKGDDADERLSALKQQFAIGQ
ncbi:MAG: phospho-sugar mutase [Bacteroidales bacterium]|nr:phospho-sugar mutase [Candidatus Cryptobacteroides fimicaballi]